MPKTRHFAPRVCTGNGLPICIVGSHDISVEEANARLIAAAPELLTALEYMFELNQTLSLQFEDDILSQSEITKMEHARAAIAKAQGQEEPYK